MKLLRAVWWRFWRLPLLAQWGIAAGVVLLFAVAMDRPPWDRDRDRGAAFEDGPYRVIIVWPEAPTPDPAD